MSVLFVTCSVLIFFIFFRRLDAAAKYEGSKIEVRLSLFHRTGHNRTIRGAHNTIKKREGKRKRDKRGFVG